MNGKDGYYYVLVFLSPVAIIIKQLIQSCCKWHTQSNKYKSGIAIKLTTSHGGDHYHDNGSVISNNNTILPNINIDAAVDRRQHFVTITDRIHRNLP
jgi:hypothetical protein